MPKNASQSVLRKIIADPTPAPGESSLPDPYFRCPACGATVNGADRVEVALHHAHVLHPQFFNFEHARI